MMAIQKHKPLKNNDIPAHCLIDGYLMGTALGPLNIRNDMDGDASFSERHASHGQQWGLA